MSLPELRGTGRLLSDVRTGTTTTDKPYASALVKFPVWKKVDGDWVEQDSPVASVIAYDDNATLLAGYSKGDDIGIHGTCKPAIYRDKPQLSVTATQIWTPEKATKPAGEKTDSGTAGLAGLREARAAASSHLRRFDARRNANQETAA